MGIFINNSNFSIRLSLTALRLAGFWSPEGMKGDYRLLYNCYAMASFMFLLGTYLIIQIVDLFLIWGNLPLMTGTAFVLFTNLSHAAKIVNILARRRNIQAIITDADNVLNGEMSDEGKEIIKRSPFQMFRNWSNPDSTDELDIFEDTALPPKIETKRLLEATGLAIYLVIAKYLSISPLTLSYNCDRETKMQQLTFFLLTFITIMGWAGSAEKNQLPLRAWYPYDTSKSPAYELTYIHQVIAINVAAFLNVSKDTLVASLIAQCRCRLRLVGLALKNLCNEEHSIGDSSTNMTLTPSPKTLILTPEQEDQVRIRLRACAVEHQKALEAAAQLQQCFSEPTFGQFAVSLVIICVTAFQLVSQTSNLVRLFSMGTYLLNMMFQVFIYCYQGNQLSVESEEVAGAAYEFPWYSCSVRIRRSVLILMKRCRRTAKLTAGGFTTLSLASYMSIIKTSYSMFTLLQQVNERN